MGKNKDKPNIEDEINELLGKLDNFPKEQIDSANVKKFRKLSQQLIQLFQPIIRPASNMIAKITISNLVVVASVLILTSFFLRRIIPFAIWGVPLGVAFLIAAFGMLVFGSRQTSIVEQNWRGKSIKFHQQSKLKRLITRIRSRLLK
ncbi:MAG: hypothetical protein P8J64_00265 [Dehalococcoidia bacterium]|jgi:hypothetical protein|nr:hypothetical protein [Dehalococcoidia bacterium]